MTCMRSSPGGVRTSVEFAPPSWLVTTPLPRPPDVARPLLIRADGGPGIGAGHLARGLALTEAWRDGGGDVMLVSEDPPPAWMARYRHEGASVVTPRSGWEREPAAWVVLDGYRFGIGEQRCLKDAGHRLAVIDDHGAAKGYAADLVVDQNLGTSAALYADRPRRSSLLLGPTYALLRREFRQQEPRPVR